MYATPKKRTANSVIPSTPKRQRIYNDPKYQPRTSTSVIRKLIRNAAEPKHKIMYDSKSIGNGIYRSVNLTGSIANGNTSEQREGDSIRLEYFRACIGLPYGQYNSTGRFNSNYRILLIQTLKEANPSSIEWASGTFSSTDLFDGGAAYRQVDGLLDKKKVTVLYDKLVDVRPQWAKVAVLENFIEEHEKEDGVKWHRMMVPIHQTITYKQGTQYTTGKKNLYLIVICNNGSESSNFGNVTYTGDLCFKETR